MAFNFSGLLNRKYKKIFGKVRFVGINDLNRNIFKKNTCVLISSGYGLLSASQIEAGRRAIKKVLGKSRKIRLLVRIFPYISLTGKPSEVRMGRGKGSRIRKWVCFVKPGKILFEIRNVSIKKGEFALGKAALKISVKSRFLYLNNLNSLLYKI